MELDRNITELISSEILANERMLAEITRLVKSYSEFRGYEHHYLYVVFLNGMIKEFSKGLNEKVMKKVKENIGVEILRDWSSSDNEPPKWLCEEEEQE